MKKIILFILVIITNSVYAYTIPSSRTITWQGNAGSTATIPSAGTVYTTLTSSATTSQIQTALNNCPSGQVVALSAGTYTLTNLSIPSNVVLRGAGMGQTILNMTASGSFGSRIKFHGGYTPVSVTSSIGNTYTKGSSTVTVTNGSSWAASGYVYIDQLNDSSIGVTGTGSEGTTYAAIETVNRALSVLHHFTRSGNVLTIDPPAIWTFTSALSARAVQGYNGYITNAGVESLTIKTTDSSGTGVLFQGAANCWAYKVEIDGVPEYGFRFYYDCFRNTVRQCYANVALNNAKSYAVEILCSSFNLIESNLLKRCELSSATPGGSCGNVIAYNYGYGTGHDFGPGWFMQENFHHSAYPMMNLYEGNYSSGFTLDQSFGPAGFHTWFRNRATGWNEYWNMSSYLGGSQNGAILISYNCNYNNIVGNILGHSGYQSVYEQLTNTGTTSQDTILGIGASSTSDTEWATLLRHRNYNYLTNSIKDCNTSGEPGCQGGDTDTTLADSLYLASKPSWFGSLAWPPYNPVGPVVGQIPAEYFYLNGSWPTESGDVTAPVVTIKLPVEFTNTYSTSSSSINISGTATDAVGVTSVTWANDRGGSGTATCATCDGTSGTKSWSQNNITLQSGVNIITFYGRDVTPNTGTDVLTVTYTPPDTTPTQFTFTDITGATLSTVYTSNLITVAGINTSTAVTVTGGTYSKNGGTYTSVAGTAVLGDTFRVRHTSSSGNLVTTSTTLTIGGISDTYSVTTLSATDSTAPTVTITTSTPQAISADSLSVAWTDYDAVGVTLRKWRIGAAPTDVYGTTATTPATTSGYAQGANTLYIGARDAAGNWGSSSIIVNRDSIPPIIDNLSPSGILVCISNPRNVTLSLTTQEIANASYSLTDVAYASMTPFTTTGTTNHSQVLSLPCGSAHTYYIRTIDAMGNANLTSSQINFSISNPQLLGPGGLIISGGVKIGG